MTNEKARTASRGLTGRHPSNGQEQASVLCTAGTFSRRRGRPWRARRAAPTRPSNDAVPGQRSLPWPLPSRRRPLRASPRPWQPSWSRSDEASDRGVREITGPRPLLGVQLLSQGDHGGTPLLVARCRLCPLSPNRRCDPGSRNGALVLNSLDASMQLTSSLVAGEPLGVGGRDLLLCLHRLRSLHGLHCLHGHGHGKK